MPNLSIHGQRELSTGLQLLQNDQNHTTRDAGTGLHYGGIAPCPLKGVATGAQVPLHNRFHK